MGLADFFRPKYRHSDVAVRTEAVRALSPDEAVVLESIARTDKDVSVRKLAIDKLRSANVLAEIASSEGAGDVADYAGARAATLWVALAASADEAKAEAALDGLLGLKDERALVEVIARAQTPSVRKRALTQLHEPRALADLARRDVSLELKQIALQRIDDVTLLRGLAVDAGQKDLGLMVLDRIDDAATLEYVATKAKHKAVRQRARKLVTELNEAIQTRTAKPVNAGDAEAKRRRAERVQLLGRLDAHAETFEFANAEGDVAALVDAYAALRGPTPDALDAKFDAQAQRFHKRRAAFLHKQSDAKAARERQVTAQAEPPPAVAAVPHDDGEVMRPLVDPQEAARREARKAEAEAHRLEREAQLAARAAEKQAREAEAQKRQAEKQARLAAAAAEFKQVLASMEALVAGQAVPVEGMAPDGKTVQRRRPKGQVAEQLLGRAAKLHAEIARSQLAELAAPLAAYESVRTALASTLAEKRDADEWQRWHNVPQAESLVRVAEELRTTAATADATTYAELAGLLREVQAAWKEVGPLPAKQSKELWDKFKQTCDDVYAQLKGPREQAQHQIDEAIAARQALIAKVEALATSTDWAKTAETIKSAQAEWKTLPHVPRRQADELWQAFRTACDGFFERRKPVIEAQRAAEQTHLVQKEALIAKVRRIVDDAPGVGGWGKAIGQIKQAQEDWRAIGHVPKAEAQRVWQVFRSACDDLFAKRAQARDVEANAWQYEVAGVREEFAVVQQLTDDTLVTRADALATRVLPLILSEEGRSVRVEFGAALAAVAAHVQAHGGEALKGSQFDPVRIRQMRTGLITQLRAYLPKAPQAAVGEDVAAKLAEAMRQNAFRDLTFAGREPREVIDELRTQYHAFGADVDEAQGSTFHSLCAEVVAANGGADAPAVTAGAPRGEPTALTPAAATDGPTTEAMSPEAVTAAAPRKHPRAFSETSEVDEMDTAWDLDDHRPVPRAPVENSSPGAAELAGDGAVEGDGLDAGWD